jgi:uncharacterized repeat protein (TIGR04076 family)
LTIEVDIAIIDIATKIGGNLMALDPKMGFEMLATVIETQGHCSAGHKKGDTLNICCHDSGGLCGFFYNTIFANLQTFQFGGNLPWWQGDTIMLKCPDPHNTVTIKLERTKK